MEKQKKIAAAVTAVLAFMQEQAAAAQPQAGPAESAPDVPAATTAAASPPATPASLWGVSGRQSQMQLRNLMQLRAVNRL